MHGVECEVRLSGWRRWQTLVNEDSL